MDDKTISRWVQPYEPNGLPGLQQPPHWGGAHGQSALTAEEIAERKQLLCGTARPGTVGGSGWTNKAGRAVGAQQWQVTYRQRGLRQLFARLGGSSQRGRQR